MKLKIGDKIDNIKLNSIDDQKFELKNHLGKKYYLHFIDLLLAQCVILELMN